MTPTRRAYSEMKGRCTNVIDPDYSKYGAFGVKICSRWRDSFAEFLADMGERPRGTVLKRVDVTGDFEPDNCVWRQRKRTTELDDVQVEFNGIRMDLKTLAKHEQVNVSRLWTRLKYLGESTEDAIHKMKDGVQQALSAGEFE
jgi:hypothetical protein